METTCLFCRQVIHPECQDTCYLCLKDRICPNCLEQSKQEHARGHAPDYDLNLHREAQQESSYLE